MTTEVVRGQAAKSYAALRMHVGHTIVAVDYGDDVTVECETCALANRPAILLNADRPKATGKVPVRATKAEHAGR